jgi:hypothetical protein
MEHTLLRSAIPNAAAIRFQVSENTIVEHFTNRPRGDDEKDEDDRWQHAKLDLKSCFLLNCSGTLT